MADRRWLGKAKTVKQVARIAIGGTWATSDTLTITIDGIDLVVTIGANTTNAQVATTIVEAYNGTVSSYTDTTASSSPPLADGAGAAIPQLTLMTASVDPDTDTDVLITGGTKGDKDRPFTISVSETAASGTATLTLEDTAATGPHHYDDADNWSGDTLPADGDDIIFDSGAVNCSYGLTASIQPGTFTKMKTYTGYIGLPQTCEANSAAHFPEYLAKYLTFDDDAGTASTTYDIELGDTGTGSKVVRIDAGAGEVIWNQYGSGSQLVTGQPPCLFIGTDTTNVFNVHNGELGIAFFEDESAGVATLRVGDGNSSGAKVTCGDGVTFTTPTIDVNGGALTIWSATTGGTVDVGGSGSVTFSGTAAHPDIEVLPGGTCYYNSTGTITTLKVQSGGTFDARGDNRAFTVTNVINLYKDSKFLDPIARGTYSAGLKLNGTSLKDTASNLDFGPDLTMTLS